EAGPLPQIGQPLDQRGDHRVGRGRDFERADAAGLVHDDEVAERAADVNSDAIAHGRASPREIGAGLSACADRPAPERGQDTRTVASGRWCDMRAIWT